MPLRIMMGLAVKAQAGMVKSRQKPRIISNVQSAKFAAPSTDKTGEWLLFEDARVNVSRCMQQRFNQTCYTADFVHLKQQSNM